MICIEIQKRMSNFINEELDKKTLEEFLVHIRSCESCREDLEVYYTLFASIKLLDEDKNKGGSYQVDFEKMLRRAEEVVHHEKIKNWYKKIAVILFIIVVAVLI